MKMPLCDFSTVLFKKCAECQHLSLSEKATITNRLAFYIFPECKECVPKLFLICMES